MQMAQHQQYPAAQMQAPSFIGSHQGTGQSSHHQRVYLISADQKRIEVPHEITQMCRNIPNIAKPVPQGPIQHLVVQTKSREEHLQIVAEYCASEHYIKTTSSIPHPLRCNNLEENVPPNNLKEVGLIKDIMEDFQQLKQLMATSKLLGCEPLYQLCAAALASWFRRRTIRNVYHELDMDVHYPYSYQLEPEQILKAKEKFEHFVGRIDYPQLNHYIHKQQQQQRAAQQQLHSKEDPASYARQQAMKGGG